MDIRVRKGQGQQAALLNNINGSDSAVTALLLFSVLVAVCGSFVYGAAVGYTSPVESQLMDDLALSTAEFSLFGSMLSVGVIFGSLFTGKITDLLGRRGAMGFSDVLYITGGIVISISEKAWSIDVGRFLVGCGTGIIIYTVPIYISEITPKNLRGGFVTIIQLMSTCGTLAMFTLGSFITWRVLVLFGVLPALIQLLGLFFVPESPRYLAKNCQNQAHEIVLQRLRGDDIDISVEAAEIQEFTEFLKQMTDVNFFGLFQEKYTHQLVVVLGLMALGRLGGTTAITYYASSIFESAGFSSSIGPIGTSVIQLPSIAISIYLVDKFGRRPLLMLSAGGISLCCMIVGLMFVIKESGYLLNFASYSIAAGIWGYCGAYTLGLGNIPFVILSEIFPMNAKGAAGSLASVTCGVCAWIASYAFNFAMQWSCSGTFFIYAGINAFTLLFVAKMVPETKGKTLEQIQSQTSLQ